MKTSTDFYGSYHRSTYGSVPTITEKTSNKFKLFSVKKRLNIGLKCAVKETLYARFRDLAGISNKYVQYFIVLA
jgi:hypothetical protein